MRTRRFLIIIVGASATLGSSIVSAGSQAEEADTAERLDVVDEIIAETMARDYDLSLDEARRRTLEQDHYDELVLPIRTAVGYSAWGGSWIDHEHGGTMIVHLKRGADLKAADEFQAVVSDEEIEVRQVEYSLEDLDNVVEQVKERIQPPDVYVDPVSNEVVVGVPEKTAEEAQGVAARLDGLPVRLEYGAAPPIEVACGGYLHVCDQHLRGGVEIAAASTVTPGVLSLCTGGLVVKSNSDAKRFLITAGHCLRDANGSYWVSADSAGTYIWIGLQHQRPGWASPWLVTSSHDVGMIYMSDPMISLVSDTRVLVAASGGNTPTTRNEWYDINGVGFASNLNSSSYLCYSGSVSKTECSQFVSANGNFVTMKVVDFGAAVCQGDSGSPVYKNNKAYGMVQSITLPTQTQTWQTYLLGFVTPQCVGYNGTWKYYSMSVALSQTNTTIM